jgi:hypothetical protein
MKTLTLHGVPYNVNDKNEVFLYKGPASSMQDASNLCIGSWNPTTQTIALKEGWQQLAAPFLAEWRQQVRETTEAAMKKAHELQGVASSS